MGLCKDCVYYVQENRNSIMQVPGEFLCELTLYDGGDTKRDTLARAEDAEGYYAALYVQPNFGCVQFEAKTE